MYGLLILVCMLAELLAWDSGLYKKYDSYGVDWIFMPDGNGNPQVAVLKVEEPLDTRLPLEQSVGFLLYTRSNSEKPSELRINDSKSLSNSFFSPSKPTKFITHGWKSSAFSASIIDIKKEYLVHGDYNVFVVNWKPLAASTFYLGPMRNTVKVGSKAAEFIDFLSRETGLNANRVHFIGHSLGAHVAGNTGEQLKSGKLGRLTGLDPALPGFHLIHSNNGRLSPDDAKFVDIIHSCGGVLGYMQPLGQVDFYPNAGVAVQPGCCCIPEIIEACSHGRSYQYFSESINSKIGLRALECDTWDNYEKGKCANSTTTLLGEPVDESATGSYFLKTRSEPPFANPNNEFDNNIIKRYIY